MSDDGPSVDSLKEYRGFVVKSLQDLAWENNYPINTNVGLFCFVEALKHHGFEVKKEEGSLTFRAVRDLAGQLTSLQSKMTLDEVSRGWRFSVPSSPRAFYDSIFTVYDRFSYKGNFLKPAYHIRLALSNLRDGEPRQVRKTMDTLLKEYFLDYQEHMLTALGARDKSLQKEVDKPEIFDQVVRKFPWTLLNNARRLSIGGKDISCTPNVETLVLEYPDLDLSDFTADSTDVFDSATDIKLKNDKGTDRFGGYHPTENVLDELFLGMYLQRLARRKGYALVSPRGTNRKDLAYISENNFRALKSGREVFLKEKS